jgi:putative ABC transport system permease protein
MNIILSLIEQGLVYVPHILAMCLCLIMLKIPFLALETAYVVGAIFSSIIPDYIESYSLLCIFLGMITIGFLLSSIAIGLKYYLEMSYLLISILLWGIFYGINQWVIGGTHISLQNKTELLYSDFSFVNYPQLLIISIIVLCLSILFWIFSKTQVGKASMVYGNNNKFFDYFKISSWYIQWIGLSFAACLSAFSGFLNAYSNGFADVSMAQGVNMLGITMLILGLAVSTKKNPLLIVFTGVSSYLLLQKTLLILHVNSRYFISIQAVVIILLMAIMKLSTKGEKNEQMGL